VTAHHSERGEAVRGTGAQLRAVARAKACRLSLVSFEYDKEVGPCIPPTGLGRSAERMFGVGPFNTSSLKGRCADLRVPILSACVHVCLFDLASSSWSYWPS